jgi:hypothetical protein
MPLTKIKGLAGLEEKRPRGQRVLVSRSGTRAGGHVHLELKQVASNMTSLENRLENRIGSNAAMIP